LTDLDQVVPESSQLDQMVSDLEGLADRSPVISVAAIHILKNELGDLERRDTHREILFEQRFSLPGGVFGRLRQPRRALSDLWAWLSGTDNRRFRDRCDQRFWESVVPVIESRFGEVAEPMMNTANEAIINYAEYSFRRWSLGRRVTAHLFLTEDNLGYAIVRPHGTRLRVFDPLDLKEKSPETLADHKRGWGHTILMRRALFLSFDKTPKRRGLMIVVGPGDQL
jgi:hypothetical protein